MDSLYSKLDESKREIRLLIIHPPAASDLVINCSLETTSLNGSPSVEFSALSYVWGNANITEKIQINGVPIAASTNLVAALVALRTSRFQDKSNLIKELPERIWVDALCINQQDVPERNLQVQLMRDIYSRAVKVISWLGSEADGSTETISLLRTMAFEINRLGEGDDLYEWVKRYPHLVEESYGTVHAASDAFRRLKNLDSLWRRDYWRRTWILQEAILARDILIVCGEECITWGDVTAVDKWLEYVKTTDELPLFMRNLLWPFFGDFLQFLPGTAKRIESLRRIWKTPNNEADIRDAGLQVLRSNTILQATDPRDKIYGLLGLLRFDIVADYDQPVRAVYIEAATKHLENYGLAMTINQAGIGHGYSFNLPSWVPNWNDLPGYWRQAPGKVMPTTTGTDFVLSDSRPDILKVRVFQLGNITDLEAEDIGDDSEALSVALLSIIQRALSRYNRLCYPTGIPILQAILRLLLGDRDLISLSEPGPGANVDHLQVPSEAFFNLALAFEFALCSSGAPHLTAENKLSVHDETYSTNLGKIGLRLDQSFPHVFSQLFVGNDDLVEYFEKRKGHEQPMKFSTAAQTDIHQGLLNLTGRRFFYAKDRYIGLGPPGIRVGDIIVGITGCPFPVILRRCAGGYNYVGRCYVEGWNLFVRENIVRPVEIELF